MEAPEIQIRQAGLSDIALIRAMANVVFRKTYSDILSADQMEFMMDWMYSESSLSGQVASKGKYFFIAEKGGIPAGYVSFETEGVTPSGLNMFHLQKLYVMPEFQGQGLGRAMLDFVKEKLRSICPGGCRVELNVNRNNNAVGFYEHYGMKRDRQGDFPIGNGFFMNDYIYCFEL